MAVRAQAGHQGIAISARNRLLAGRINRRDDHRVGIVEAGAKLVKQVMQTRIAMRLYHGDDFSLGAFPRSAQHGGDLDGVVSIVVNDLHPMPFADARKAPFDAAKIGQCATGRCVFYSQRSRDRDRRRSIQRVVPARIGNVNPSIVCDILPARSRKRTEKRDCPLR